MNTNWNLDNIYPSVDSTEFKTDIENYRKAVDNLNKCCSENFTITNKMGLHMRPANIFVTEMLKFSSDIEIIFDSKTIDGKSIMNIMAGCIKCGSEITVKCNGPDETEMLKKVEELIASGFGEE